MASQLEFASRATWALGLGEQRRGQRREDPREQEGRFQMPLYFYRMGEWGLVWVSKEKHQG